MSTSLDEPSVEPETSSRPPGRTFRARMGRSNLLPLVCLLVALFLLFGFVSPHQVFFSADNLVDMAEAAAIGLVLAAGMTFVLSSGMLDLSIGSNLILSSICGAKTIVALSGPHAEVAIGHYQHLGVAVLGGFVVCVLVSVAFSLVNAFIVTRLKINSFITTLATTGIGTGLALAISGGIDVLYVPPSLQDDVGGAKLIGIPVSVIVAVAIGLVLVVVMTRTRFGTWTQAIGSSRVAADRAGIPSDRHLVRVFVLMGLLVGIAAFMDIVRFSTTNIAGHQSDALAAIAAVVIGGTSLFGGRASVGGSMLGSLLPVMLATGLVIVGLSDSYQYVAVGVVLLAAVYVDRRRIENR